MSWEGCSLSGVYNEGMQMNLLHKETSMLAEGHIWNYARRLIWPRNVPFKQN